MTLVEGAPAPDFALRDQHGATVQLSGFAGERAVVLMFFPFAFSRVCTGELAEVQTRLPQLQNDDVQILAISCDPVYALRVFAETDGLELPLLSDFWPHGAVASSYGVLDPARGCAKRSTYVLDRGGLVRWSVHHPSPEARDLEELLGVLARL